MAIFAPPQVIHRHFKDGALRRVAPGREEARSSASSRLEARSHPLGLTCEAWIWDLSVHRLGADAL
eukprot:3209458-Pyramimonas_sp.AAC.1